MTTKSRIGVQLQTGQCDASMVAGVREAGTVERGGKGLWGNRRRAAVGEEKEEALCNLENEINRLSKGVELSRIQSLSANTVFRSAMTAS